MDLQPQNVFIPVPKDETREILSQLRLAPVVVVGRSDDRSLLLLETVPIRGGDWLVFSYKGAQRLRARQDVTFTFNHAREKYVFKISCTPKGSQIVTRDNISLFRVLRRADFRLTVPASYESSFFLKFHMNPIELQAQIRDISASGCQIAFENINRAFKPGDHLRGIVKFYRRPELLVECEVRHVRKVMEGKVKVVLLGIQFDKEDIELEKKMRAVVLDLYRELFSTFSRRLNQD